VCDTLTRGCVDCLEHDDCSVEKPVCLETQCIACTPDDNMGCGSGLTCRAAITARDNVCVGCVTEEQCPGESVCESG
jgi:hypothetical protein